VALGSGHDHLLLTNHLDLSFYWSAHQQALLLE
jgi:hypothetical protein